MRAIELSASQVTNYQGSIICHNIFDPANPKKILIRKGHIIDGSEKQIMSHLGDLKIHLIILEEGDIDESTAAERIARAAAGTGLQLGPISEGSLRIEATVRGILRVDIDRLRRVNEIDGVLLWTLHDRTPVEIGQHVASAKIAPLAISEASIQEAESQMYDGVIHVAPYQSKQIGVIVQESMGLKAREKFEMVLKDKIAWFGSPEPILVYSASERIKEDLEHIIASRCDLVLIGGTSSLDPLDPAIRAIEYLGGEIIRRGVPAHPGSTYWLGSLADTPIIGVASCGMFSQRTALDLIMTRFFAGEQLDNALIANLGHGGLITREVTHMFPKYTEYRDIQAEN
mgnify:FL=1